jgi:hypothetical protein
LGGRNENSLRCAERLAVVGLLAESNARLNRIERKRLGGLASLNGLTISPSETEERLSITATLADREILVRGVKKYQKAIIEKTGRAAPSPERAPIA